MANKDKKVTMATIDEEVGNMATVDEEAIPVWVQHEYVNQKVSKTVSGALVL